MTNEVESSSAASGSSQAEIQEKRPSGHTTRYRKVYRFFGFTRSYNFPLWVIFAGAMLGFSLSRLHYFNFDGEFSKSTAPGYWYYFGHGAKRIAMILHFSGALPAGILMVLQFTPIIRHKFLLFHRLNGYLVLFLLLISNVSVCVVFPHNHSGNRIAAQSAEAFLVIITTAGMGLAWWNIRRLQIDQHRAWMLRTMFYFGSIITSWIFGNIASWVVTSMGGYYNVWTCDEIDFLYKQYGLEGTPEDVYPQCFGPGATKETPVVVNASRASTAGPEQAGSSSTVPFGSMLWLAVVVHIIGIEIYLALTPRESERLRRVSYEKQLEAGYKHPGSAGLTSDRWGDAEEYKPA